MQTGDIARRHIRSLICSSLVLAAIATGCLAAPALSKHPTPRTFGVYVDPSRLGDWTRQVGVAPDLVARFEAFSRQEVLDVFLRATEAQGIKRVMVSWEPWKPVPVELGNAQSLPQRGYRNRDILHGAQDPYIRRFARSLASFHGVVYLRYAHEMNGDWYPWSIDPDINPDGAADYIRMWRRVHDIFAAAGARNVIWVWSPNRITYSRSDFSNFYPGDAYVDWIGLGGYYRNPKETATLETTLGPSLRALRDTRAFRHAPKPLLLSEIGATERGGQKAAWISDMFAALAAPQNADVIGFCWFNDTVTSAAGEPGAVTNDWRITSSKQAAAAFAVGIADPRYAAGR